MGLGCLGFRGLEFWGFRVENTSSIIIPKPKALLQFKVKV